MMVDVERRLVNWRTKARLLRVLGRAPGGYAAYQLLQRHFGLHRNPAFIRAKLQRFTNFAHHLASHGATAEGKTFFEVGTGWTPLYPLGFWCLGAERVHTYDLSRHLLVPVFRHTVDYVLRERSHLEDLWSPLVAPTLLRARLDALHEVSKAPERLLKDGAITYSAPSDAASTDLRDASVDVHYSSNVLEHIPASSLKLVLKEARRVTKTDGLIAHHVDASDHFAHSDRSIPRIHFLRFTAHQWSALLDERLSYANRLRFPEFVDLFREAGMEIEYADGQVDKRSLEELAQGFPLDSAFSHFSKEDVCRLAIDIFARPRPKRLNPQPPADRSVANPGPGRGQLGMARA